VVVGRSTPVVAALQQASNTVPIVFVNANDPIRFGFVQSLARPGGNITGFISWDSRMGEKWLEILKEIAPGIARVGLIYNPQTYTGQQNESLAAAAPPSPSQSCHFTGLARSRGALKIFLASQTAAFSSCRRPAPWGTAI
jgi:ABC-type uncharacterized transport system substrate-binding protein